MITGKEKFLG